LLLAKLSSCTNVPPDELKIIFLNGNQVNRNELNECETRRYLWSEFNVLYEGGFDLNYTKGYGILKKRESPSLNCLLTYSGDFSNGKLNGNGVLKILTFEYLGMFFNSTFHGKGMIRTENGSFNGEFFKGERRSGIRIYGSEMFFGDFIKNKRSFGKYIFDNGDCYTGSFKGGLFEGYGEYKWKHSSLSFYGFWKDNRRNGLGITNKNENLFVTNFELDEENLSGLLLAKDGKVYLFKKVSNSSDYEIKEINKNDAQSLKKFFDKNLIKNLNISSFLSEMAEIDAKYKSVSLKLLYPSQFDWFNEIKIGHSVIWNFIKMFPSTNQHKQIFSLERYIKEHENIFKGIYQKYVQYSNIILKINNDCVMKRIGLWKIFRDLRLFEKSKIYNTQALIKSAEKEFGIFIINANDPIETVSINSFLHYLFYIVIFINQNDKCILSCAINQHSKTFGLFTTMLIIFVKEFIFNMSNSQNDMLLDLMIEDNTFFGKIQKIITFDDRLTVRNIFKILIEWKVKYDQTFIDGN